MIRTERFKYARYGCGGRTEQLTDLLADPGETNNLAEHPAYKEVLKQHQELLMSWQLRTWDHAWEKDPDAVCAAAQNS
jgi:hypothetical protein